MWTIEEGTHAGLLPAWIAWDFCEDEQRYSPSNCINQLMVGLSWNYTRCLSSSSMVHLIVAWLLLLSHWKCAWEAIYVENVSFKQNRMWSHLIDCLKKEITSPLQRHIPIISVCHFILLWFGWLRSTDDEVFVKRVRNESTGKKSRIQLDSSPRPEY